MHAAVLLSCCWSIVLQGIYLITSLPAQDTWGYATAYAAQQHTPHLSSLLNCTQLHPSHCDRKSTPSAKQEAAGQCCRCLQQGVKAPPRLPHYRTPAWPGTQLCVKGSWCQQPASPVGSPRWPGRRFQQGHTCTPSQQGVVCSQRQDGRQQHPQQHHHPRNQSIPAAAHCCRDRGRRESLPAAGRAGQGRSIRWTRGCFQQGVTPPQPVLPSSSPAAWTGTNLCDPGAGQWCTAQHAGSARGCCRCVQQGHTPALLTRIRASPRPGPNTRRHDPHAAPVGTDCRIHHQGRWDSTHAVQIGPSTDSNCQHYGQEQPVRDSRGSCCWLSLTNSAKAEVQHGHTTLSCVSTSTASCRGGGLWFESDLAGVGVAKV